MNVAIIEDDISFGEKLKMSLEQRFENINITLFNKNFEKVLKNKYDICFFDILLKEENGIRLSKEYHQLYTGAMLVLMSSHDHLIYDIFDSNPMFFLRKSKYDEYFNKLVNKIKDFLFQKENITAFFNRKQVELSINAIVYVEVAKNTCYIHTIGEVYTKVISMSELSESLNNNYFHRINYQEIINLEYVERISDKEVFLLENLQFKISRNKRTELLQKYHEFLRKNVC